MDGAEKAEEEEVMILPAGYSDDARALWNAATALNRAAAAVSPAAAALPPMLFFTDPDRTPRPWETAARLPAGSAVVYRAFGASDAVDTGHRLREATADRRVKLLVGLDPDLAEAIDAERVFLGINAVDYSGYPDCRPEYLSAYQTLADLATKAGLEGRGAVLTAPLAELTKADIVREALAVGVPIDVTWSCYQGGEEPCGVCDSCRIRDKALIEAGRPDLATTYAQAQWAP